jgi:hypothetical protein
MQILSEVVPNGMDNRGVIPCDNIWWLIQCKWLKSMWFPNFKVWYVHLWTYNLKTIKNHKQSNHEEEFIKYVKNADYDG